MSRETEKIFREFHKFIEGKDLNEESIKNELDVFMEKYNKDRSAPVNIGSIDATTYLDLAYDADSEENAIKYAKKALQLDKNCLDAKLLIIECEEDIEKAKLAIEKVIKEETKRLTADNLFTDDDIGHFYGMIETRPYMRARALYVELLSTMNKIRKAAAECEDMIRLSTNDNMGMRYQLMTFYAHLEEVEKAEDLYDKYPEESFSMLFPLGVLYYKIDNLEKVKSVLKRIDKENCDYAKFVMEKLVLDDDEIDEIVQSDMFRPSTVEEVIKVFQSSSILFSDINNFNKFARNEYVKASRAKKKK